MKRKSQNKNEKPKIKKIKRAILVISSLFFVFCSLFFVIWWRQGWNGREPINVVVSANDRFWVLAVRPQEERLVEIEIPPNMIVPVGENLPPEEKATWQARALWELSQLEQNPAKVAAVGWELLEVPVDLVIRFPSWESQNPPLSLKTAESIRLIHFVRSLHQGQITTANLGELGGSRREVDPGGTELIQIDLERISAQVTDWFQINHFRQQDLSLAIRNISGVTGAGNKLARQLEHSGLRIISVDDGLGGPALLVKDQELLSSFTVKKLESWLGLPASVSQFDQRADILVSQ